MSEACNFDAMKPNGYSLKMAQFCKSLGEPAETRLDQHGVIVGCANRHLNPPATVMHSGKPCYTGSFCLIGQPAARQIVQATLLEVKHLKAINALEVTKP